MSLIVPAILTSNFDEFKEQIARVSPFFSLVQIDVMDGEFVANKSFEEVDQINEIPNLPDLELHLMVKHPLEEMKKWDKVKNIRKIIFQIESADDPLQVLGAVSGRCAQAGIAINPETPLTAIEPCLERANEILFLTVHPGKQGAEFLPEVGKKIRDLSARPNRPLIGVDGGITAKNIAEVASWGVDIFRIGSAITMSKNIETAASELNAALNSKQ
jgi:ribulose-phosphate 3-epimerase